MVALEQGVSLTSEAIIAMPFPRVVFRPIAGNSDVLPFSGVWLLRNSNQALRRFIGLARSRRLGMDPTNLRQRPLAGQKARFRADWMEFTLQVIDVARSFAEKPGSTFADNALVLDAIPSLRHRYMTDPSHNLLVVLCET